MANFNPNQLGSGRTFRSVPLEKRFWEKVNKTDGCWLWTASKVGFGHGQIFANGKNRLAHRVSWEMVNGPVPSGLWVLHRCDNPGCVRPSHLFLGTHADNMADMAAKGRHRAGARSEAARAAAEKVRRVLELRRAGWGDTRISREVGMARSTVYRIVRGLAWKGALETI